MSDNFKNKIIKELNDKDIIIDQELIFFINKTKKNTYDSYRAEIINFVVSNGYLSPEIKIFEPEKNISTEDKLNFAIDKYNQQYHFNTVKKYINFYTRFATSSNNGVYTWTIKNLADTSNKSGAYVNEYPTNVVKIEANGIIFSDSRQTPTNTNFTMDYFLKIHNIKGSSYIYNLSENYHFRFKRNYVGYRNVTFTTEENRYNFRSNPANTAILLPNNNYINTFNLNYPLTDINEITLSLFIYDTVIISTNYIIELIFYCI